MYYYLTGREQDDGKSFNYKLSKSYRISEKGNKAVELNIYAKVDFLAL